MPFNLLGEEPQPETGGGIHLSSEFSPLYTCHQTHSPVRHLFRREFKPSDRKLDSHSRSIGCHGPQPGTINRLWFHHPQPSRKNSNQNLDNSNNRDNANSDKGKENELEHRHSETERILGLNIDSHDREDDNDSEGGVGILHQNLTSASSALQVLLRKLGAVLDDLLTSSAMGSALLSHQSGRLKKILSGLKADGEEGRQVEALTQLCHMLSIGTEDSLSTFSVDSFVPVLVGLLNHESNPDIMLLAGKGADSLGGCIALFMCCSCSL